MPRLRQITCQVEWPETGLKFEEYGTVYGDGLVETFIAVPDKPQPFSVHLTSKGYIAEGLAMLVYIDGEYQCNRNRLHLKPPKKGQARDQTDVDIRLRQKEKTIGGGTFIGRDWRFDCHNIVPNGQFPGDFDPSHFDQLGMIEVIVLRCRAKSGNDSGSESLTHESILCEIDNFGQAPEDAGPADKGGSNHQATVADAPEEAGELAGLAALPVTLDGAADGGPRHFGFDGEAPPPGYWTYHAQTPPRNDYRTETRPERRVHFDHGSPRAPNYPTRTQSQPHYVSQPKGGYHAGRADNTPSNWHRRDPADYGAQSAWHGTQQAPTYPEKGNSGWSWGIPSDTPQNYGKPVPGEYSDYADHQPHISPPNQPAPHHPAWMGPGNAGTSHSGWFPTPSAGYPIWTPQPQFAPGPNFPTTPVGYSPFYQPPYGFQGPGYMMSYPIPAGGWPPNQSEPSGSLDPAKEENNQVHDSGNQGQDSGWGNNDGNGNNSDNHTAANTITTGEWGQGGDANNTNDAKDSGHANDGDQQSGNDANATGWGDPQTANNETQGTWDGNNAQNTETQGSWDNNAHDAQNSQPQGNWENNANTSNANQPQQTQDQWTNNHPPQPLPGTIATNLRSARSLYGPYGAYYSATSRPHGADGLSPAAEAEEEPPFDVPETVAAEKHTTHQVQPGKGYLYVHKCASPEYVDGIEEPYARFVFKYRTKEQIEREIGITIECEPTGDEEKRKFTDKTQDELIELLIRAQNALGGKIPAPPPVSAGEESAKLAKSFNPAPVPAPTAYKYLQYELPKGRNPGLGISNGGNNAPSPQAQSQQQQQATQTGGGGGGGWQMSWSGPAEGWGAPPTGQQQTQMQTPQSAPSWQTAAESGNQNQNQNQGGGGNSNGQNGGVSRHSSPGDGGWGPNPAPAPAPAGNEAALPAGGTW